MLTRRRLKKSVEKTVLSTIVDTTIAATNNNAFTLTI